MDAFLQVLCFLRIRINLLLANLRLGPLHLLGIKVKWPRQQLSLLFSLDLLPLLVLVLLVVPLNVEVYVAELLEIEYS